MDFGIRLLVRAQNWQQRSDHDGIRADPGSRRGGGIRRLQDDGHFHHRIAHQRRRQPLSRANRLATRKSTTRERRRRQLVRSFRRRRGPMDAMREDFGTGRQDEIGSSRVDERERPDLRALALISSMMAIALAGPTRARTPSRSKRLRRKLRNRIRRGQPPRCQRGNGSQATWSGLLANFCRLANGARAKP